MATTKTDPKLSVPAQSGKKSRTYEGLTREQLIEAYRLMYMSRRIDDREILLKRQQKIFFQMSGAGHEAIGVAAGMAGWAITVLAAQASSGQWSAAITDWALVAPYLIFAAGCAAVVIFVTRVPKGAS